MMIYPFWSEKRNFTWEAKGTFESTYNIDKWSMISKNHLLKWLLELASCGLMEQTWWCWLKCKARNDHGMLFLTGKRKRKESREKESFKDSLIWNENMRILTQAKAPQIIFSSKEFGYYSSWKATKNGFSLPHLSFYLM